MISSSSIGMLGSISRDERGASEAWATITLIGVLVVERRLAGRHEIHDRAPSE